MGVAEKREPTPQASGFSRLRLKEVRSCLASGGAQHVMVRVGLFLRVMGQLLGEVGLLCELHGQDGGIVEVEQEDAGEEAEEMGLMQTADSRRRTEEAGTSSRAEPRPTSRGVREEELTKEGLAIMAACEADEAWQTLRSMRPATKQKFMSAVCILVQEIVEDNGLSVRYHNWAKRWEKMSQKHASFTEPLAVSLSTTLWALQLPSLCGSQTGMRRKPRHTWIHKPLRPLAPCLPLHLYTVCQKREQVLQRERVSGKRFRQKTTPTEANDEHI